MAKKRIAILTLSSGEPRLMLAGVDDGQVFIIESQTLARSMLDLKLTLPDKLDKLKKAGFVVLVDEVIPYFSKYGRAVKLSELDPKGRPIVVAAMEAFNNLKSLGAITFPKGDGGRFDISPSLVDEVKGPDGKPVYNIDWTELRPDTYALLFAVYAATQDSLLDSSSLKSFLSLLGKRSNPQESAGARMRKVIVGRKEVLNREGRQ